MSLSHEIRQEAQRVAGICDRMSLEMAKQASRRKTLKRIVEALSAFAGIGALIVSVAPSIQHEIGGDFTSSILFLSGSLLIFSVILDRIFSDPPERFADYAMYIGSYESRIREILLDEDDKNRANALKAVLRLAEMNINDARKNWPHIYENTKS